MHFISNHQTAAPESTSLFDKTHEFSVKKEEFEEEEKENFDATGEPWLSYKTHDFIIKEEDDASPACLPDQ